MPPRTVQLKVVRPNTSETARPRPPLLRALGRSEPPLDVEIGGSSYRRIEVLKHDSWAATAIYQSPQERIVCKFNRKQNILGVPAGWIGRWLATRESFFLQKLADLPNVPDCRGPVSSDGRLLPHCSAHLYVEGHPLRRWEFVDDEFFPRLRQIIETLHQRGIAYVDLHKRENVIAGDDGQPHLIDFQVCFMRPQNRWLAWALQWVERLLKDMDRYHLSKHVFFHRPDLAGWDLTRHQKKKQRPWLIRAHRLVARPLRTLRRKFLVAIRVRRGVGLADSEHFPEDAVRHDHLNKWPRKSRHATRMEETTLKAGRMNGRRAGRRRKAF